MSLLLAVFIAIMATAAGHNYVQLDSEIKADSDLARKLLTKARKLAENKNENNQFNWVSGYSLKFQGCHQIKQWNDNANDKNDVKISTKKLVRFRLCPTSGCSDSKAAGCSSGYGDYIIDMDTYLSYYYEATKASNEQKCADITNNCNCDDAEDADKCKYDCFASAGMTQCAENNPYDDGEQAAQLDVGKYLQCGRLEGYNRNRDLQENANYFLGPYCAQQGGSIFFGVFLEDTCSEAADDTYGKSVFSDLTGQSLPYADTSIIGMECVSCLAQDNDADAGAVGENCGMIYSIAGKCESSLPDGLAESKNTNACSYIEGIKIVRTDGIVASRSNRTSPVATAFIVMSAMLFSAMAFYTWYLRKRIGVKKDSLM
jgi:hypothetical protein